MSKLIKKVAIGLVLAFVVLGATALIANATSYTFGTSLLKQGSTGTYVKNLQTVLNQDVDTQVALTGAGSPGSETSYFGALTKIAVKKFQTKYPITGNVDGLVGNMTKAQLAVVQSGTLPPTPPNPTGPVTVALATDNPASSVLVATQATADLAHFAFGGTGIVTNMTFQRIGVSSDATPSNIYLFDGMTRITDAASVTNGGIVTFNNPQGLFTVMGAKTIAIKADILTGTSGQTVGMKLVSYTVSGTTTPVTVNISGNTHSIASATLATVGAGTVTPTGTIINPAAGVTLWQSTLTIAQRDVYMKRIAFRQVGSAPANSFQNFKLYVQGVQVGTATGIDSLGYVTFDLSTAPVTLLSGARIVRVDADVVSGASRTVQLSLRQASDVDFVDSSYGVNITPTTTPWVSATANTISGTTGGSLTIEKDVTSPATNVVNGGSDVNLGTFKLTAYGEPIKLENLRVAYTGSANIDDDDDTLRNGRVLVAGVQYGSTAAINETTDGTLAYTSYSLNYTVYPGTPVLVEVHSDIYDDGGTNDIIAGTDTITAVIAVGSSNATRVDSLGTFAAPATAVSANTLTVGTTTATLTKNGNYTDQTTTLPVTGYKIGSWTLAGSSIEDILLSTLSLDVDEVTTTEFDEGDITNMYAVLKTSTGTVITTTSPLSTVAYADNNFQISYTLLKNTSIAIELYANLATDNLDLLAGVSQGAGSIDALDSFKTDLTVTGTALTGGSAVTATSADTDGQTIAYGSAYVQATTDGSSPVTSILSDNQTVTSAAFKFAALTAGYNVTSLTLTIPSGAETAVSSVSLYDGANPIPNGTLMGSGTTYTFSGINWNVPANTQNKVLTVKLTLGAIGSGAGTSGSSLLTTLTSFTATNTSTGVATVSSAAGNLTEAREDDPAGVAHYVYAAIPVITQGAVSTSLTNSEGEMYKFTVAPQGGTIAVKQLRFAITVTDVAGTNTLTLGSWKLMRGGTDITTLVDIHNTVGATIESTNTIPEGTAEVIVTWATEEQISGTTEYTLRATPAGFLTPASDDNVYMALSSDSSLPTAGNDYLLDLDSTTAQVTVGLQNLAADAATGVIEATVSDTTDPNIVWSDISALPFASTVVDDDNGVQDVPTSSGDWANGFLVQNMPLSGITKYD
jgi:hypothetical protein